MKDMNPNLTPGWEHEPADPSVGIMSDSWWHCGDDEAEQTMLGGTTETRIEYATFTMRLTCPACRETTTVSWEEYVGDPYEFMDDRDEWEVEG